MRSPRSSGGNVGPDDRSGVYSIDFTPYLSGSNNELLDIGVTVDAQGWSRSREREHNRPATKR